MISSYLPEDVTILLKDISGQVTPLSTDEREKRIQSGVHYSEMLPIEYVPTETYMQIYSIALDLYASMTANAVAAVAESIWHSKGKNTTLVSLARAGTSIGVLIKRYLKEKYSVDVAHYTISIIRGKGIDNNAMRFILKYHSPESIQFVDGWTGKGAIQKELNKAMKNYENVSPGLAVLSDPAWIAEKCGTHEDFLIASSCLNSTVSGLLSRTFYRSDIIGKEDFHGAVFYKNLQNNDLTYQFINTIAEHFTYGETPSLYIRDSKYGPLNEVESICHEFNISDINLAKPSIGEATRVLLRRVPWKILVHSKNDDSHLGHLYQLAKEKNVEVIEYPMRYYKACGLIKSLADN